MTRPDNLGQTPGPWETHLCDRIMKGLLPDIAQAVKQFYVGCADEASLSYLRCHARHAQQQLQQRKKVKEEKVQKELHMAAFIMYNTVASSSGTVANQGAQRY